jgi:hypothetical protein
MSHSKQTEKFLVSQIQWIMQIPNKNVHINNVIGVPGWTKISVDVIGHRFVLEEIPGNSYSIDVVLDGKNFWVTDRNTVTELLIIKDLLKQQYASNEK